MGVLTRVVGAGLRAIKTWPASPAALPAHGVFVCFTPACALGIYPVQVLLELYVLLARSQIYRINRLGPVTVVLIWGPGSYRSFPCKHVKRRPCPKYLPLAGKHRVRARSLSERGRLELAEQGPLSQGGSPCKAAAGNGEGYCVVAFPAGKKDGALVGVQVSK